MIPLSEVPLGPINATENDINFSTKWIEPEEIKNCIHDDCWIVTGEKGSGKSAIQRAIREIYASDYFVAPLVDFDRVNFGVLYENILTLSNTTKLSKNTTLSNYWQYSIVIELIRACAQNSPADYGDLLKNGNQAYHRELSLSRRLMRLIEEAWNVIDDFTASSQSTIVRANLMASAGLSADVLHDLSIFPLGPDYESTKKEFFSRLAQKKHRTVLILDGFDTLITERNSAQSTELIFSSLIDAILSLRSDEHLNEYVGIKALIPHDRYMNLALRDSDKVGAMHSAIRWTNDSLRDFLARRISITPKIKPGNFKFLWDQVFPEMVSNSYYKIEEDSFEYVLRHTMLRPRQLQIHLDMLAKKNRGAGIDPSMVPKSIAESCRNLGRYFVDEYRLDHPNLERFILMFERRSNIMEFREFRELVASGIKRFHASDPPEVDDKIDVLYATGLFGVVRFVEAGDFREEQYYPPTKESRQHYVDFYFRKPFNKVSSRLADDTPVALHPIFVDFANLRPHPSLIIG